MHLETILQYLQILLWQSVEVEAEVTAAVAAPPNRVVQAGVVKHLVAGVPVLQDRGFRVAKARLEQQMPLVQVAAELAALARHHQTMWLVKRAMACPLFLYQIYRHNLKHYMARLVVRHRAGGLPVAGAQEATALKARAEADTIFSNHHPC